MKKKKTRRRSIFVEKRRDSSGRSRTWNIEISTYLKVSGHTHWNYGWHFCFLLFQNELNVEKENMKTLENACTWWNLFCHFCWTWSIRRCYYQQLCSVHMHWNGTFEIWNVRLLMTLGIINSDMQYYFLFRLFLSLSLSLRLSLSVSLCSLLLSLPHQVYFHNLEFLSD